MTKQDAFDAWAPSLATWSPWAKPVLFSQMAASATGVIMAPNAPADVSWGADSNRATAMVVDLPGIQGVTLALSLAEIGYRPVPLYNACPEPVGDTAIVDVRPIMIALATSASSLVGLNLPTDAPPAFLLDANRNPGAAALPGQFDNRSISLPTDFPSANLLLSRGIRRVILVQPLRTEPQADLSHTLRRWQDAGLTIVALATQEPASLQPMTIPRPKAFRLLWYSLLAKLGLQSNPLGGFGGQLPMPSSG
jgi:hypothetical protein